MGSDIAIPRNNEAEFLEIASKLGIRKLYFLYDSNDFNEEKINKKLNLLKEKHYTSFETGILINHRGAASKTRIMAAKSSDNDRFLVETGKASLLYGFEETAKKDYLHQRASGLNHIMCELMSKNNIIAGFSYNVLVNSDEAQIPVIAGRMRQNINLCQKYKVKNIIASFAEKPFDLRAPHDVSSLFKLLGMNEGNIKNSLSFSL